MLKIKQEDKDSYSHQLRPSQTLTQGGLTAYLSAASTAGKFKALSGKGSWGTAASPPLHRPSASEETGGMVGQAGGWSPTVAVQPGLPRKRILKPTGLERSLGLHLGSSSASHRLDLPGLSRSSTQVQAFSGTAVACWVERSSKGLQAQHCPAASLSASICSPAATFRAFLNQTCIHLQSSQSTDITLW